MSLLPSENNILRECLSEFGISVRPASDNFRSWLAGTFPGWQVQSAFLDALPAEWSLLESKDLMLCYLASEEVIMKTARRSPANREFLPIGARMDGAFLVIDTLDPRPMSVGCISQLDAMRGMGGELDRSRYRGFSFSYEEWLQFIWRNPGDSSTL